MAEDLNQLVDKALHTLSYVLEHPPIDYDGPARTIPGASELEETQLKVSAACGVLEFAAAMSRHSVEAPTGCKHEDRIDLTTMGPGPAVEVCRQCNARFENGVEVKG